MGSPRVLGKSLSLKVDGKDYWADATSVVLDGRDIVDNRLCGPPRAKRVEWWLDVEAIQSTASGSLWTLLWLNSGRLVPFAYVPHGNAIPTVNQPHFTGIVDLPTSPPLLGGSAGFKTEQVFRTRLYLAQGPLRVTAP